MVKKRIVSYTDRDFTSIKSALVDYAKRYYGDSYKDFNEASFGSLMMDMVAYVGDQLSFYLDYQTNESFMDTALEYGNILRMARQMGYRHAGAAASTGIVSIYLLIPSKARGQGPDTKYLPILQRGSSFTSSGGISYTLTESVNFNNPNLEVVVGRVNETTGVPTYFAVKAFGQIVSGELNSETISVGNYQRFNSVRLSGENITEIISVTDSSGNDYFEVDHLTQDVIYDEVPNYDSSKDVVPYIMRARSVPRRFTVDFDTFAGAVLTFGAGTEENITSTVLADPADVVLDQHGRTHITATTFDPTNLVKSDKLGVAPVNTTLTITYRSNTLGNVNSGVGTVTEAQGAILVFENPKDLSGTEMSFIRNTLETTNEEPITGDIGFMTPDEIRVRAYSTFATQNRAVTKQDYENLSYRMPSRFGKVKRVSIVQDKDSFKRNLNLYVLGENIDGFFAAANQQLKNNLKTWLSGYKMINDTVDILDGRVVNLGINFEVVSYLTANKHDVLVNCISALKTNLDIPRNISEAFYISQVYKILNSVPGVVDTTKVEIVKKTGPTYTSSSFDVETSMSSDGRYIKADEDIIFEFRYPDADFVGVVK